MALFGVLHANPPRTASPTARQLYDFLSDHPTGVLATVDPNGEPHAVTIYYNITPDLDITFVTKQRTKKHDNLVHHNHAMLVIYDDLQQTSIQIRGIATTITGRHLRQEALRHTLRASLHQGRNAVPPIAKIDAGDIVGYQLRPVEIKIAAYAPPAVRTFTERFETITLPLA